MILKVNILIFFVFLSFGESQAQIFNPQFKYYHTAYQIQNSPLIVRLNMKKRTIEAYKRILSNKNLDEKERLRTETSLTEIEDNRDRYKTVAMRSFGQQIDFTEVLFIENQNFSDFSKGATGHLFTKDKEVLKSNPDEYYVLIQGDNDLSWKIVDKDLQDLGSNVFEAELGFKRVVNWAVGEEDANIDDMNKVAEKLNDRLVTFYSKRKAIELLPLYLPVPYRM